MTQVEPKHSSRPRNRHNYFVPYVSGMVLGTSLTAAGFISGVLEPPTQEHDKALEEQVLDEYAPCSFDQLDIVDDIGNQILVVDGRDCGNTDNPADVRLGSDESKSPLMRLNTGALVVGLCVILEPKGDIPTGDWVRIETQTTGTVGYLKASNVLGEHYLPGCGSYDSDENESDSSLAV